MPADSPAERRLISAIGAYESWARTDDRPARTAPARAAFAAKFLEEAGGDPVKAEALRLAYYKRLALRSAQARRRQTEQLRAELEAEIRAELEAHLDDDADPVA